MFFPLDLSTDIRKQSLEILENHKGKKTMSDLELLCGRINWKIYIFAETVLHLIISLTLELQQQFCLLISSIL